MHSSCVISKGMQRRVGSDKSSAEYSIWEEQVTIIDSKKAQTEIVNEPKLLHKRTVSRKRTVRAKEFVAAFREMPDDSYLMAKFAITPRTLGRIYSVLIEKGMLSKTEYSNREGKAPELEEPENPDISTSTTVRLVEEPSEGTDRTHPGIDPGSCKDLFRGQEPNKTPRKVADLCPNCGKPKKPSSPEECIYCGVIFRKLEILNRKRTTLGGSPTLYQLSS
jgi:hypothetical protein